MAHRKTGRVRIIAGKWRGRRLPFPCENGLRPTPDRVRETVFNWLSPYLEGAVCLDVFAGSGALGFEALSRGAKQVVMIERSKKVVEALHKNAETLNAKNVEIIHGDALKIIPTLTTHRFNMLFLDPPYAQCLIAKTATILEQSLNFEKPTYIYIEAERQLKDLALPSDWQIIKDKVSGDVRYCLVRLSGCRPS